LGQRAFAEHLLRLMNKIRPPGATRYYGGRSLDPIRDFIELPIAWPLEEVEQYIEDAAELVRKGLEPTRYWSPWNLFGEAFRGWMTNIVDHRVKEARRNAHDTNRTLDRPPARRAEPTEAELADQADWDRRCRVALGLRGNDGAL